MHGNTNKCHHWWEKKDKKNVPLSKLLRVVLQKPSIAEHIGYYNRCLAI